MPLGKETGTFTSTATSVRMTAVDGANRTVEGSYEGEVTGELAGPVLRTITFSGDNEGGTYTGCGMSFDASGDAIHGEEQGAYMRTAPGVWATRGVVRLSTGQTIVAEGEVALAARTWEGKLFELK